MTSIETSTFSGSAGIANTAVFVPKEATHTLDYVYTTPEWHDDFISWPVPLAGFLESIGLTAKYVGGGATGVPGTELAYTTTLELFARPGADLLVRLPKGLPEEGDWKLVVTTLDGSAEPVTFEFSDDANKVHKL